MAQSQFKLLKSLKVALKHAQLRINMLQNDNNFADSNSYYCEFKEWIEGDYQIDEILFIYYEHK